MAVIKYSSNTWGKPEIHQGTKFYILKVRAVDKVSTWKWVGEMPKTKFQSDRIERIFGALSSVKLFAFTSIRSLMHLNGESIHIFVKIANIYSSLQVENKFNFKVLGCCKIY